MSTDKRTARRKRQRERRKLAVERLSRRQEERQHEKEIARWLLQTDGPDTNPALIEQALAQVAGTPLEGMTAELLQLAESVGDGDDLEGVLERVSGWLDRCEAQLTATATQEAEHAQDA